MDCKACKENHKTADPVPYIVHEGAMTRDERRERRMLGALVLAIIIAFVSNALWLHAWTQYDHSSEEITYTQDGEGVNIIGDSNEVIPNVTE